MDKNIYMPQKAVIKDIVDETRMEKRFVLSFADGASFVFKPGQFIILSIMGVGEAPFSITSDNSICDRFEICVRAVGRVSKMLHNKKIGDFVGVRGPYGSFFSAEKFCNQDIVFIAGGIGLVPLRSLILECLRERDKYRDILVLYGSKNINDMVYKKFVRDWEHNDMLGIDVILDDASETKYKQGLITKLLEEREFAIDTHFIICGPPIMYRFVIKTLIMKGVEENRIWLSLERHMKCGVGKCGHCRIDDICVCESGPVFNYVAIKDKKGAI